MTLEMYGSTFLPLNKNKGNCDFLSHNSDFFSHNFEFTSRNSELFLRIAYYKFIILTFSHNYMI